MLGQNRKYERTHISYSGEGDRIIPSIHFHSKYIAHRNGQQEFLLTWLHRYLGDCHGRRSANVFRFYYPFSDCWRPGVPESFYSRQSVK